MLPVLFSFDLADQMAITFFSCNALSIVDLLSAHVGGNHFSMHMCTQRVQNSCAGEYIACVCTGSSTWSAGDRTGFVAD